MRFKLNIFVTLSLLIVMMFTSPLTISGENKDAHFQKEKVYFQFINDVEPYQIKNEQGYSGFEIDYINKIFEKSKYELVITDIIDKNKSKNVLYFSSENRNKDNIYFVPSIDVYSMTYKAFTRKDSKLDNLTVNSLKNCKLGILSSEYALTKNFDKSVETIPFLSSEEGLKALLNGDIDVWYDDVENTRYILVQMNAVNDVKYHNQFTETIPMYIYSNKNSEELSKFIDSRIKQLSMNGMFENTYMNYFYHHSDSYIARRQATDNTIAASVVLFILLFLVILVVTKIRIEIQKHKSSNTLATGVLNHGNRYVISWKSDFSNVHINSYFMDMFGIKYSDSYKELLKMFENITKTNINFDTSRPLSNETISQIINHDNLLTKCTGKNNQTREIIWTTINIDDGDDVKTLVSIGSDVTEKNKLKRELKFSETRYKLAMESAEIALMYIDKNGEIAYLSDVGYKILGFNEEDFINVDMIIDKIHYADRKLFENAILKCDDTKNAALTNCEVRLLTADKTYRWMSFKFKIVVGNQVDNFISENVSIVGAFFDIDNDKKKDLKIEVLAFMDELTGLYNRHKFLSIVANTVSEAKETNRRCAVIALNLDKFHRFNDLYGVVTGDKILKSVANIIKFNPYGKDACVARVGGDEFACLVWLEPEGDRIQEYVQELSDRINEYVSYEYDEMKLTLSAGACIYPDNAEDSTNIFDLALVSMRMAKEDRNSICQVYNNTIKDLIINREVLEKELQEAVDKQQFEIYYQPKVSAVTEKVVGAEALIRWNHPKKGVISPIHFIPAAEEMGIISEIGKWTLITACRQNKEWQKMGLPKLKISVNISAIEFYQTDIVGLVKNTLEDIELDPSCLELELTESMALMDIDETINKMNAIKELGVGISIDDFGTGYSSLSNIQNLPIDELKLDKSFIDRMTSDAKTKSIIAAIIELSKIMGLETVAEGVEEQCQLVILREMECTVIQGYLFAKPLQKDYFAEMVKRNYNIE